MRNGHTRWLELWGMRAVEEGEVGKGHCDPAEPQIAFRKFVCILIAVGNYCWWGPEAAINVLNMPL